MKNSHRLPEVRFEYSFLLAGQASEGLNKLWGDGTPLRTFDEYTAIAKQYDEWWQPESEKILQALSEITGLEFYQGIIDVHVAPWFYAFSSPMVLGVTFESKDDLVNTLTHEITHRLLTDNTTYEREYDFLSLWRKMFGDDLAWNTLVHVPVHALLEELYVERLKRPDLLKRDQESIKKMGDNDYIAAWDYVNKHGYKTITDQLREHVKNTRTL